MRLEHEVEASVDLSEIVVQDEAKSPDDIEVILHFVTIEAHYLLGVLERTDYFVCLSHHVCLLRTPRQPTLVIKHEEGGRILEVARCDFLDRAVYVIGFDAIVPAKGRRNVVLPPVVERQFDGCQAANVGLGPDR